MARIRSIKPEFWTSLTIARLSVHARLTFIGLWNYADDHGRGVDDLRLIKAAVWPLDDKVTTPKVARWMGELEANGLVIRYAAREHQVFQIASWAEHQRVDHPKDSAFPPPTVAQLSGDVRDPLANSREELGPDWKGREGSREQGGGAGKGEVQELAGAQFEDPEDEEWSEAIASLREGLNPNGATGEKAWPPTRDPDVQYLLGKLASEDPGWRKLDGKMLGKLQREYGEELATALGRLSEAPPTEPVVTPYALIRQTCLSVRKDAS